MEIGKSFFIRALLSLMFIGLSVWGIPVAGFAGTPHSCPGGVHLPGGIGGVTSYNFNLAKNCSPETSAAIRWKAWVYDANGNVACTFAEAAVPPPPSVAAWQCGPTPALPRGQTLTVIIHYKTSTYGSWMSHSNNVSN
jgi:hypothetical protein